MAKASRELERSVRINWTSSIYDNEAVGDSFRCGGGQLGRQGEHRHDGKRRAYHEERPTAPKYSHGSSTSQSGDNDSYALLFLPERYELARVDEWKCWQCYLGAVWETYRLASIPTGADNLSKFLRIPFAGYAALAATSVGAVAAERAALPYVQPTSGWIVSIGGTARLGPEYLGSSKFGFSGSPSLSFRRQGETPVFSAPEDGLDYALLQTRSFSFGPVAKFQSGRYSGSDNKLFGLRDVPWTVEAGAFVEFWPITDSLRTRLEVRQGFHGHHGLIADASADWVERIGAFTLSGGPRLSLANGSYMDRNFGISPVEAAINGAVTPFRAKGGLNIV